MSHIVMLLSNAFRPDPRVAREAEGLTEAGHRVTVVCWDRQRQYSPVETINSYSIQRVHGVHTVYGAGPRQVLHTPRFWRAAASHVRTLQPDVIHCHDLDTLPAGWWLKRQTKARLVYDAHEDYPALMSLYLPHAMVKALSWLERRLIGHVDYTIAASSVFADKLRSQGVDPVVTIGNYQSLEPYDAVSASAVTAARAQMELKSDDLLVVYIGGFSRNRQLLSLIEAARDQIHVQVRLWGDGHLREAVEAAADKIGNVRYLGWLPAAQVPLYMQVADVIYYCLNSDYPGAIYNAPNTLSQAMAAGRPLIANDVGDLGRIVRQTGSGLLLPAVTPGAIREAMETLREPRVRHRMGRAGRAAAEAEYNWTVAKERLQQVYAQLALEGWVDADS